MTDDSTNDLTTWLRAQLDEDERVALAADAGPWTARPVVYGPPEEGYGPPQDWEIFNASGRTVVRHQTYEGGGIHRDVNAFHIARHDPARVLAEVEAKRRILDAVERYLNPHPGQPCTNIDADGEHTWEPCELHIDRMATAITPYALLLLALPFADRPGYREEWRP